MKRLIFGVIFIAGWLIMSLEILGFRILAPYFGNSVYVSGTLIGLILTALAIGYYLGGFLADKGKKVDWLFILWLTATAFLLADLFLYTPLLKFLAAWDLVWGALICAFLLFFAPMVALAAVSPIVIKFLSEPEKIGLASGSVFAWGTIGSLLGTFLTTFIFIPYFGSRLSFYLDFMLALVTLALVAFFRNDRGKIFWPILLLGIISLSALSPAALPTNVLLEAESAYNQIRLIEKDRFIYMILNSYNETLAQSIYTKKGTVFNVSIIDLFSLGAEIVSPKNILILGMSGGASIRQFQQYFPQTKIDAVEIDPVVIEIAGTNFGVSESENLKIYLDDARPFLAKTAKKYDLVEVDLFQGGPYVPFYTLSKEFFAGVENVLTANGVMVMNIYTPAKKEILKPALATIASIFPSVFEIPIHSNTLALATKKKTSLEEIKNKIKDNQIHEDLGIVNQHALMNISPFEPQKNAPIFTDDWAPVETITYQMVKGLKL